MNRDYLGYDDCISCIVEKTQDILRDGMLNVDYICPNLIIRAIEKQCSGFNCNITIKDMTPSPDREVLFCPKCLIVIYTLRDNGIPEKEAREKIKSGIVNSYVE